jgi:non-ribosomal peptide synthetase component F
MSNISQRLAGLPAEKRALLEQRLLKLGGAAVRPAIPRRRPSDHAPLSFAQQRLWFLDQLTPGSATYNAAVALRLRGELDTAALRRALDTLVARHEVLRTVYIPEVGTPKQVVLPARPVELPVLDLRNVAAPAREDEAQAALVREVRRPFDLTRDLMLRPALVRQADDDFLLQLTTHHIASDGWSKDILFRELEALYGAFSAGGPNPLPDLPIQYADFAFWQRQQLQGERLGQLLAYWRQRLAGAPELLTLPTDRRRPVRQSFRGVHLPVVLPGELSNALKRLGRQEHATPFMTLLAAFKALLACCAGQDDIVVGSPILGRNHVETEPLIGFFVNTLVLRTDLSGDPSFGELLRRVRESALGAYAHQDLPFEKLVEALRPRRTPSWNPLFQVNFRAQTAFPPPPCLAGLRTEMVEFDQGTARFDLALELWATDDVFAGYVEYSTDLFEAETVSCMVLGFETLLRRVVERPDVRLSELRSAVRLPPRPRPGRAARSTLGLSGAALAGGARRQPFSTPEV